MTKKVDTSDSDEVFSHYLSFTVYDKVKYCLCAPVLVPIRLVSLLVVLLLACLWCKLALINTNSQSRKLKPFTGCRRYLQDVMYYIGLALCYLQGYRFEIKGHLVARDEAPILVLAPHMSVHDLCVVALCKASLMARDTNNKTPLIWAPQALAQCIYVQRRNAEGRNEAKEEIVKRATSPLPWRQLLIFPEGTTTNGSALTRFYAGSFEPGVSVQPITIKYSHPELIIWTWKSSYGLATPFLQCFLQMCNPCHKVTVEFLPVYKPSPEEQDDPIIFANNVQKVMADSLQIKATDVHLNRKKLD